MGSLHLRHTLSTIYIYSQFCSPAHTQHNAPSPPPHASTYWIYTHLMQTALLELIIAVLELSIVLVPYILFWLRHIFATYSYRLHGPLTSCFTFVALHLAYLAFLSEFRHIVNTYIHSFHTNLDYFGVVDSTSVMGLWSHSIYSFTWNRDSFDTEGLLGWSRRLGKLYSTLVLVPHQ